MWLGSISTWPRGEATMSVTDIAAIDAAICEVRDAMEENLCPILCFLIGLVRVDWCLKGNKRITKYDRRFSTCQAKQRCPPRRSSLRFPGSPGFLSSSPFSFLLRNWYNLVQWGGINANVSQFVCISNDPSHLILYSRNSYFLPPMLMLLLLTGPLQQKR